MSASAVVIHYEEALYQVYEPLPLPVPKFTVRNYFFRRKIVQYVMGILQYFLEQFISTAAFRMQIDLSDYEKSGTWDVFDVPGDINTSFDNKTGQYISRANYTVHLRRKTLFYTVNLIVPSVQIGRAHV